MIVEHSDVCTPALCYCHGGDIDGTPISADYKDADQPLPGRGKDIDLDKVYSVVKNRMGNEKITKGIFRNK